MCGRSARTVRSTLVRRPRRVERAVGGLDLVRVGDAGLVLLDPRRALVERADEQLAAEILEPRGERAVVVVRPDRLGSARQTGPESSPAVSRMIETPVSRVAGHDRPLDRRRAAPARQQRRVDVEELVVGQQRLLDQRAVRADEERVGRRGGDLREHLGRVERPRAGQRDPERARRLGHRRRLERPPAALRPVRARDTSRGRCALPASRSSTAAANADVPR